MANINGTSGDETLLGSDDADVINQRNMPRAGSDIIRALAGDDIVYLGTGRDDAQQLIDLDAGAGNDVVRYTIKNFAGLNAARLVAGTGDDVLTIVSTQPVRSDATGTIAIDGGEGRDTLAINDVALVRWTTFANLEGLILTGTDTDQGNLSLTTAQLNGVKGNIAVQSAYNREHFQLQLLDGGVTGIANSMTEGGIVRLSEQAMDFTGSAVRDNISATSSARYVVHAGGGNDKVDIYTLPNASSAAFSQGVELYGEDGDDSLQIYRGNAFVIDGGSGLNEGRAVTAFDGATIRANDAASATGLLFADGSVVRNIQSFLLDVTGTGNIFYAADNGSSGILRGTGTVAYGGAGSDSLSAETVYITPGGQDSAFGPNVHVDYSSATARVRMDALMIFDRFKGTSYENHAWIGGSDTGIAGSIASVGLDDGADILGSQFDDIMVGRLFASTGSIDLFGGGGDDIITPGASDSVADGGAGTDTLSFDNQVYGQSGGGGVSIDLSVMTPQASGYGVYTFSNFENVTGTANDDQLRGNAGANRLVGGAGNDRLSGGGGNDVLTGGSGSNLLDGGDGADTATYAGYSGRYDLTLAGGNGRVSTIGISDTLAGIETIRFTEGMLSIDADGPAAEIYRLYQSALGREPDQGGFDFWTTKLDRGISLESIALDFTRSAEFAGRFGALANDAFVDALYHASFDRAADDSGRTFYIDSLNQGTLTRTDIVLSFTQSDEQRDLTAADVGAGLWATNETQAVIGLLYGGLSNGQFIDKLYQEVLDRAPDAYGRAAYLEEL